MQPQATTTWQLIEWWRGQEKQIRLNKTATSWNLVSLWGPKMKRILTSLWRLKGVLQALVWVPNNSLVDLSIFTHGTSSCSNMTQSSWNGRSFNVNIEIKNASTLKRSSWRFFCQKRYDFSECFLYCKVQKILFLEATNRNRKEWVLKTSKNFNQ